MQQEPQDDRIFATIDATWAPYRATRVGDWTIREGRGGGSRVSAASYDGDTVDDADIDQAEYEMTRLSQDPLFQLRARDQALDDRLAARSYRLFAPVRILGTDTAAFTDDAELGRAVIPCDRTLAIQRELWAAGGIGPARIAVMDRVSVPKTALLARSGHDIAGVAFVAVHQEIGMLHALEVAQKARRNGHGRALTRAAAAWSAAHGAKELMLLVTRENASAIGLYQSMGFRDVSAYHYRIKTIA